MLHISINYERTSLLHICKKPILIYQTVRCYAPVSWIGGISFTQYENHLSLLCITYCLVHNNFFIQLITCTRTLALLREVEVLNSIHIKLQQHFRHNLEKGGYYQPWQWNLAFSRTLLLLNLKLNPITAIRRKVKKFIFFFLQVDACLHALQPFAKLRIEGSAKNFLGYFRIFRISNRFFLSFN